MVWLVAGQLDHHCCATGVDSGGATGGGVAQTP